jgi:hypothetical protein
MAFSPGFRALKLEVEVREMSNHLPNEEFPAVKVNSLANLPEADI